MKTWLLLLLTLPALAANFDLQQSYLLDAGVSAVTVTDSVSGTTTPVQCSSTAARNRISVAENGVPPAGTPQRPAGTTTYSTLSGNPAAVTVFQNWGLTSYWCEAVDAAGVRISINNVSRERFLPMIEPACPAAGVGDFPIEVIGQRGFVVCRTINVASAGTSNTLRIKAHNLGFKAKNPVDQKCEFSINGGAWTMISGANMTAIDEPAPFFGDIGSAVEIREGIYTLLDGVVVTGDNTIRFRSNYRGTDSVTSGCRILDVNFQKGSLLITGLSVTSSVATYTVSSTATLATGDWVYVVRAPGTMYAMANGNHQITVIDSTHFSSGTCENHLYEISSGACSAPNGTYPLPTSYYTTGSCSPQSICPSMAQPTMAVARQLVPFSQYPQKDMSAETAPSGGDASAGSTFWHTATLVVPDSSYGNYNTVATCSHCHFKRGDDLFIFGFSNHSIEQRTLFHGGSWTDAKNVAAYIRSLGTTPATGRPYNPSFQPAPGLDSLSVVNWMAGGGIGSYLVYDADKKQYVCPADDCSGLAPTAHFNWRQTPTSLIQFTWDQWLPPFYPGDYPFTTTWVGSPGDGARDAFLANVPAGDVTTFKNYDYPGTAYPDSGYMDGYKNDVKDWVALNNLSGSFNSGPGYRRPSQFGLTLFSATLLTVVSMIDVNYELGFTDMLDQLYVASYGSSTNSQWVRGYFAAGTSFQAAPHFQHFPTDGVGMYDETNVTWNHVTNAMYSIDAQINAGNRWGAAYRPFDINYISQWILHDGNRRPNFWENFLTQLAASQEVYNYTAPSEEIIFAAFETNLSFLNNQFYGNAGFTSLADQTLAYTQWAKNVTTMLGHYTRTQWCAGFIDCAQTITGADIYSAYWNAQQNGAQMGASIAGILPALKTCSGNGYCVDSTVVNNLTTAIGLLYLGHDFTADRDATYRQWVGKPGAGGFPSMPTYSNCSQAAGCP